MYIYLEDILVTGRSHLEHLQNLREVLKRLEEAVMRLKKDKCAFLMPEVEYLGHSLQPTESKVRVVANAPEPRKVAELRLLRLGLVNYYGKFLPNLAATAAPLNDSSGRMQHGSGARSRGQHSRV